MIKYENDRVMFYRVALCGGQNYYVGMSRTGARHTQRYRQFIMLWLSVYWLLCLLVIGCVCWLLAVLIIVMCIGD